MVLDALIPAQYDAYFGLVAGADGEDEGSGGFLAGEEALAGVEEECQQEECGGGEDDCGAGDDVDVIADVEANDGGRGLRGGRI